MRRLFPVPYQSQVESEKTFPRSARNRLSIPEPDPDEARFGRSQASSDCNQPRNTQKRQSDAPPRVQTSPFYPERHRRLPPQSFAPSRNNGGTCVASEACQLAGSFPRGVMPLFPKTFSPSREPG